MVVWEYLVETINTEYEIDRNGVIDNSPSSGQIIDHRLAKCGTDSWELVSLIPAAPVKHFKGAPENPWIFHAIFKRALQS
jgi:hypothetical protein